MKKLIGCAMIAVVVLAAWSLAPAADKAASKNANLGKLRHVVLFKFKDGTAPEKVKEIEVAFGKLPSKISEIVDYEWGTNVSHEGLSEGLTHCFLVTFRDAKACDTYIAHKEHKKFVELLKPHLEKAVVVDYVAKE
jgi:hypothetical protein